MKYIKIFILVLSAVFFIQCNVMKPASEKKITKELSEYKVMTEYILCKNYHKGFENTLVFGFEKAIEIDSLLYNFMRKKNISSIYINKAIDLPHDSIKHGNRIEYHFFYIPAFGRRRELRFDFSNDKQINNEKKEKSKQVVLEKGIYYVEY